MKMAESTFPKPYNSIMASTNKDKVQHGADAQKVIEGYILQLLHSGLIAEYKGPFRIGYAGFKKDQFYAPFLITFLNGEKWIVYSTTSYRSDRIKEQFWDTVNLKHLDNKITKAYLVYPTAIAPEEEQKFKAAAKLIVTKEVLTSLDAIFSFPEFKKHILDKITLTKSKGYQQNARGAMFETEIANALKNAANLRELRGHNPNNITDNLEYLNEILNTISVDPYEIAWIEATSDAEDIGLLPTGGKPKTDVLADIHMSDGTNHRLTISAKKTSSDRVTVAQYKADDIADAVDPGNCKLKELLNKFQKVGAIGFMDQKDIDDLTEELQPIMRRFCLWVLGGIGGLGNTSIQWARYIAVSKSNDPDDFEFWPIDEYIDELLKNSKGHFGTPFSWTYASGEQGKSIQLKAKVL